MSFCKDFVGVAKRRTFPKTSDCGKGPLAQTPSARRSKRVNVGVMLANSCYEWRANANMTDGKVVNIAARKTESEWIMEMDRFWLSATPEIFKWLGWGAALVAMTYVAQRANSGLVRGVVHFYYVAMFFYFNSFFFQFIFTNPPIVKNARGRHFISLTISGLLAGAVG